MMPSACFTALYPRLLGSQQPVMAALSGSPLLNNGRSLTQTQSEDTLVYSREDVYVVTSDTSTVEDQALGRVRQEDGEFQASWAIEGDPASTNKVIIDRC